MRCKIVLFALLTLQLAEFGAATHRAQLWRSPRPPLPWSPSLPQAIQWLRRTAPHMQQQSGSSAGELQPRQRLLQQGSGRGQRPSVVPAARGSVLPSRLLLFFPGLAPAPAVTLVSGLDNAQPTVQQCGEQCKAQPECTCFAYCAAKEGCAPSAAANLSALPTGGCQLLWQGASSLASGEPLTAVEAPGVTGGAVLFSQGGFAQLPFIDSFLLLGPQELLNRYDYACPESLLPDMCLLNATAAAAAAVCGADPRCQALIAYPGGYRGLGPELTKLQGGTSEALDLTAAVINQNAVMYLKGDTASAANQTSPAGNRTAASGGSGGGGLSSGAVAGITVAACAAFAVLVAAAVLICRRRRGHQSQEGPSVPGGPPHRTAKPQRGGDNSNGGSSSSNGGGCHHGSAPHAGSCEALPPDRRSQLESKFLAHFDSGSKAGHSTQSAHSSTSLPAAAGAGSGVAAAAVTPAAATAAPMLLPHGSPRAPSTEPASPYMRQDSGTTSVGLSAEDSALLQRLPDDDWQTCVVPYEKLTFCRTPEGAYELLGTGTYGSVYKVMFDGVSPLAAKIIELESSAQQQERFLEEAAFLRRIRSKHIVGFAGVSVYEGRGIILMELMEGGSLSRLLPARTRSNPQQRAFSWYRLGKRVAYEMALALHYLHNKGMIHVDVKSSNILLTRELHAKLGDVGFARIMSSTHQPLSGEARGTFAYCAPELLLGDSCTQAVDIYSFGILAWELCTGEAPQRGRNRLLQVPDDCPQEVADLVQECCSLEPAARPTAKQLVERLGRLLNTGGPAQPQSPS